MIERKIKRKGDRRGRGRERKRGGGGWESTSIYTMYIDGIVTIVLCRMRQF